MNEQQAQPNPEAVETWATVELMGHAQTAGRITRPSDWGGLLRVDVPVNGGYRTEFYGMASIYSVKLVSEAIARAFAQPVRGVIAYDTPIVTREQHEAAIRQQKRRNEELREQIRILEWRLVAIGQDQAALPAPAPGGPDWSDPEDKEDDDDER